MTGYSYEPALAHDWLAVAATGRLLVARVADPDRVGALAATGSRDSSVQEVLEVLTAQGLAATGPFALLFWVEGDLTGQGLGVIVRGDARVTVETTDGPVSVSSRGVTTWTEQVIESPTGFRVEVDAAASAAPALPLTAGSAWVSRIGLAADAAADSPATQARETPAAAPNTPETAVADAPAPAATPAPGPTPAHAPAPEETRVFQTSTRTGADPGEPVSPAAAHETPAAESDAAEPEGYDYLFGATVFRPVGAAAGKTRGTAAGDEESLPVPAFVDATRRTPSAPGPQDAVGDHDGRTVLASDISAARQQARASRPAAGAPAQPAGHSYLLELPGGDRQPLTAPVILGRAPSVSNVPASVLPHLVTLTGDDISRSHVRVAVEGGTVVVTDLHSSNGTHVVAPGKLPQLLRAGEPTPVITGTAIDLGSGVVLRVSEA